MATFVNDICPGAYTSMTKVSSNGPKWQLRAYPLLRRSPLTHWTASIRNPSVSTEALLQSWISCGRLSVLMKKRNVILFPSVLYLNHPSVPFSSSFLLALRMEASNRFFGQGYTFFVHQLSSLVSSTSFFGPKKRPGTTTHLEWFQGIVQHLCGTYPHVVCKRYPDFSIHSL